MTRILLISLLLLFFQKSKAQFSDTVFYYAGISSTGTFNKTITNSSYLFNNGLRLGAKKKSLVMNSTNKWLYGVQNNKQTNNDFSSAWDFNLYKTFPHFYYWGMLNYTASYSLKINHQFQGGFGLAYNIIDRPNLVVNLSDGIIYDYSDLNTNEGREIYGTPRNSFRLHIKWNIKEVLVFRGNGFLQNSLEDQEDYIIKSDASLSVKIKKWLSLTSAFNYNRMTRTNSENIFVTYGIVIEKYF